jgi:hypothetical protein
MNSPIPQLNWHRAHKAALSPGDRAADAAAWFSTTPSNQQ